MSKTVTLDLLMLAPTLPDIPDARCHQLARTILGSRGVEHCHVSSQEGAPELVITYDEDLLGEDEVQRIARKAGGAIVESRGQILLSLPPMVTSHEARRLEGGLRALPGVLSASVSRRGCWVEIEFQRDLTSADEIARHSRVLISPDTNVVDPSD